MEQTYYLIDSNVVIDYLASRLPSSGNTFIRGIINDLPIVSVITKIEVLCYTAPPKVQVQLNDFFNDATVIDLSADVVNESIEIKRQHKIKLPDGIIAATALVNSFTLITRNTNDFKNIQGLKIINPWEL